MRPTRRFMILALGAMVPALFVALRGMEFWPMWILYIGLLVAAFLVDFALSNAPSQVVFELKLPVRLYIGDRDPLRLCRGVDGARSCEVSFSLDIDRELTILWDEEAIEENGLQELGGDLGASKRGTFRVESVQLAWPGPLGLVERRAHRRLDLEVAVVPNTRAVQRAALRFFNDPDFQSGLKIEHYLGDGSEFDALREYQPGFDPRALDWKASARHRKLLVREYRAERNHDVVLALDTGRLMGEPIEGLSRLDHAVNAQLFLAWCILKSGDRVGLYGFDDQIRGFLKPAAGMPTFHALQRQVASFDYGEGETNHTLGLNHLEQQIRRRSLVILVTEFADTIGAELMIDNIARLARRHLVVFVSIRDTELEALSEAVPNSTFDMHRAAVAGSVLRERQVVLHRLSRMGIRTLDIEPGVLSPRLVNEYLEIKRRELV